MGRKIFIGVPVYGEVPALFVQSLAALITRMDRPCKIQLKAGDSLVTRARNVLTADFLASDCTHLLFIDSDLVFTPDDVTRITSHDVGVVGGMYALKHEGPVEWCGNGKLDGAGTGPNGLQEVRYIGTGFICVARHVFEQMRAAESELEYQSDAAGHRTEWDFWRVGVRKTADERPRYLSEDWYFCQRWLELGGKVFADTRVILKHVGTAVYPLQSQWDALKQAEDRR